MQDGSAFTDFQKKDFVLPHLLKYVAIFLWKYFPIIKTIHSYASHRFKSVPSTVEVDRY